MMLSTVRQRQIHSRSTQGTRGRGLELLIDKQGKIQHCRESWNISVVNGW